MESTIISLLAKHASDLTTEDLNSAKTALIGGKINDTCPCCGHQNMTLDTHGLFRRVKKCNCFRIGGSCACGVEEDENDVIHADDSHHHDKIVAQVCGCPGPQSQFTLYIHRTHIKYSCDHSSGTVNLDGSPITNQSIIDTLIKNNKTNK